MGRYIKTIGNKSYPNICRLDISLETMSEIQYSAALITQEILCEYVVFWHILFTILTTSQE